ncbi:hypothetical protein [Chondrinema litorale]|uniref:hypothetical protein n=1 Tax=Chondrinema litorale TaxID=2994555 RepID=UPI002543DA04|nr:hypothetical protein [Chondrinema litorale]UZR94267.1 hypothetical protein OQ292_00360 [Chondrinema litorale]
MDSLLQCYIEFIPKQSFYSIYNGKYSALECFNSDSFNCREKITDLWLDNPLKIKKVKPSLNSFTLNPLKTKISDNEIFNGFLDTNYFWIEFDKLSNIITYFQFGVDISIKATKDFVANILKLANHFDLLLLGSNFKVFEATENDIDQYFRSSPAYKFIKDEIQFLADVKAGRIKPDTPF